MLKQNDTIIICVLCSGWCDIADHVQYVSEGSMCSCRLGGCTCHALILGYDKTATLKGMNDVEGGCQTKTSPASAF